MITVFLAIQYPHRICVDSGLAVRTELMDGRLKMSNQCFIIIGTALLVANGVDIEPEVFKTERAVDGHQHADDFDIYQRILHSDGFDTKLNKLAIATFLFPLISEHRVQ